METEIHYRIYESPSLVPIVSQIKPVHAPIQISEIHFSIILSSRPWSAK